MTWDQLLQPLGPTTLAFGIRLGGFRLDDGTGSIAGSTSTAGPPWGTFAPQAGPDRWFYNGASLQVKGLTGVPAASVSEATFTIIP